MTASQFSSLQLFLLAIDIELFALVVVICALCAAVITDLQRKGR